MFEELNIVETIVQSYADPRFWPVAVGVPVLAVVCFLALALPYTLLDIWNPASFRRFRLDGESGDRGRFIGPSLRYLGLNFAFQLSLAVLLWPALAASRIHMGEFPAWWIVAGQLAGCLLLDDAAFYWYHRLLHERRWFRAIHGVHHRVRSPIALSAALVHPLEGLAISLGALLGPILFGMHVYVLFIWVLVRQYIAVEGHSGYDFRFQPLKLLPGHDGACFHFRHHALNRGGFGLFFSWWDRLLKTGR